MTSSFVPGWRSLTEPGPLCRTARRSPSARRHWGPSIPMWCTKRSGVVDAVDGDGDWLLLARLWSVAARRALAVGRRRSAMSWDAVPPRHHQAGSRRLAWRRSPLPACPASWQRSRRAEPQRCAAVAVGGPPSRGAPCSPLPARASGGCPHDWQERFLFLVGEVNDDDRVQLSRRGSPRRRSFGATLPTRLLCGGRAGCNQPASNATR